MAHFYLVGGNAVEEVSSVSEPKELQSDKELNTEPSKLDEERVRRLVIDIGKEVTRLVRNHGIDRVHLVMKKDLANPMIDHLDAPTAAKVGSVLSIDASNISMIEIVRRIFEK